MIQTFNPCDELLLGPQTLGQIGLGESFFLPKFRDPQGQPGRKVFGLEGPLKPGILETLFETVPEQSSFHENSTDFFRKAVGIFINANALLRRLMELDRADDRPPGPDKQSTTQMLLCQEPLPRGRIGSVESRRARVAE